MSATVSDNGWAQPANSRKFHFFRNGMSLCRKMAFFAKDLDPDTGGEKQQDDCAQCYKKLTAEKEAARIGGIVESVLGFKSHENT